MRQAGLIFQRATAFLTFFGVLDFLQSFLGIRPLIVYEFLLNKLTQLLFASIHSKSPLQYVIVAEFPLFRLLAVCLYLLLLVYWFCTCLFLNFCGLIFDIMQSVEKNPSNPRSLVNHA